MPVGIGSGQFGCDFGAVERACLDPKIMLERCNVESREMEDLEHFAVFEHSLQARRLIVGTIELDEMGIAVPGGQLHKAQLVTQRVETERYGVDGDLRSEFKAGGQIALV